jgi:carbonic anhydrase
MCQAGAWQSPVDLDPTTAVPGHFESLVLLNYDRKTAANVTNNGHTGNSENVKFVYVL